MPVSPTSEFLSEAIKMMDVYTQRLFSLSERLSRQTMSITASLAAAILGISVGFLITRTDALASGAKGFFSVDRSGALYALSLATVLLLMSVAVFIYVLYVFDRRRSIVMQTRITASALSAILNSVTQFNDISGPQQNGMDAFLLNIKIGEARLALEVSSDLLSNRIGRFLGRGLKAMSAPGIG